MQISLADATGNGAFDARQCKCRALLDRAKQIKPLALLLASDADSFITGSTMLERRGQRISHLDRPANPG